MNILLIAMIIIIFLNLFICFAGLSYLIRPPATNSNSIAYPHYLGTRQLILTPDLQREKPTTVYSFVKFYHFGKKI